MAFSYPLHVSTIIASTEFILYWNLGVRCDTCCRDDDGDNNGDGDGVIMMTMATTMTPILVVVIINNEGNDENIK